MIYLGVKVGGARAIFEADIEPREMDYPQFDYVIGAFETMAGAEFMRDYGRDNPHCQHVDDAERLARRFSTPQERLIADRAAELRGER